MFIFAVTFPIFIVLLSHRVFEVRFEDYIRPSEISYFKNPQNGEEPPYKFLKRLKFVLVFLSIGAIFGTIQWALFKFLSRYPPAALYVYRFTDMPFYHFLPGLFLGILTGGRLQAYFAARKGREYFREYLLKLDSGMTTYQVHKGFLKYAYIIFVPLCVFGNAVLYNTYIFVTSDDIIYSRLSSTTSQVRAINDLEVVKIYSERKAPNGKVNSNIYPELVFRDGSVIDTFNLVERYDVEVFLAAIKTATHGRVTINENGRLKAIFNPKSYFSNVNQSEYLTIYYNDNVIEEHIIHFSNFSNVFKELLNEKLFKNEKISHTNFYILGSNHEMKLFLEENFKIMNPPDFGIYLPEENTLVTHKSSGLGTFGHLITYTFYDEKYSNIPYWAPQGIATFFEKIYSFYDNDRLYFVYGFQNPWRIEALGNNFYIPNIEIEPILNSSLENDTSLHEKRLLAVFMYEKNKWGKYIELVKNNDKNGYNTFIEASFEKPISEIKKDWKIYLLKVQRNKDLILETPPSQIYNSKEEFEEDVGIFINRYLTMK